MSSRLTIFWRLPRTAGTSITSGLREAGVDMVDMKSCNGEREGGPAIVSGSHTLPRDAVQWKWISEADLFGEDHYSQFSVVRHPAGRLVSLFHLFWQRPNLRHHVQTHGATWGQYLKWCCQGSVVLEYHARNLQCLPAQNWLFIRNQRLPVTIGRFEDLPATWDTICKLVGVTGDLPRHEVSTHGEPRTYFKPDERRMVSDHYGWEMKEFGYEW